MRKTTIGLLILAVFAVLFAGFIVTSGHKTAQVNTPAAASADLSPTEPAVQTVQTVLGETPVLQETQTTTPPVSPSIEGLATDATVSQFFVDANVKNDDGTPVEFFCNGILADSKNADAAGKVSFVVNKVDCLVGSDAYLKVGAFESEHATVPFVAESGSGAPNTPPPESGSVTGFSSDRSYGVPEFSILTLAIAVVIGGLGLAYLRKD